jgi:metal-responsive CopG/Arc/MetJ family transcriptional regulator
MDRDSKTITFSLPSEMATKVEKVRIEEGRTMSELVREALTRYLQEREWREVFSYGEQRSAELDISPEDVETLIDEHRSESR